jgi:hypothetical protein
MMTQRNERSASVALLLSTLAFTVCFYGWTLYGPLGPGLQKSLGLSEVELGWLVAIPVVLGSVMRIPLGILSQRFGGRAVFVVLMAFVVVPLLAVGVWHTSFTALFVFGFLLGIAGASFAVGVPFVNGWYPPERRGYALGIYGMGTGGTVLAGLTAPACERLRPRCAVHPGRRADRCDGRRVHVLWTRRSGFRADEGQRFTSLCRVSHELARLGAHADVLRHLWWIRGNVLILAAHSRERL